MILGAMIIGVGIGLIAMAFVIATGASALTAFLTYWLAGCAGTVGICVMKTLFCKTVTAETPPTDQSI